MLFFCLVNCFVILFENMPSDFNRVCNVLNERNGVLNDQKGERNAFKTSELFERMKRT